MEKQILVVGSLNMDLVVTADHLPQRGETVIEGSFCTYPGGKGANQAVAAARMGGRVKMLGRVGDDAYGRELVENLATSGVNTRWIKQDAENATGVAIITVDKNGQNTIVVASGANMAMTPQDVSIDNHVFDGVGVLLVQLEIPVEVVREALRIARRLGVKTILNPAPARELPSDLLRDVDYIIPNQVELAMLTGSQTMDEGIDCLQKSGIGTVIVTCGSEGVVLANREAVKQIPAYQVVAVDTVAAGDAFTGAFAVALSEGLSDEHAIQLANAAAAISVTRKGAQPSMPIRVEVDAFFLQHL